MNTKKFGVLKRFLSLLAALAVLTGCSTGGGDAPRQEDDGTLVLASFQPFGVSAWVKQAVDEFNSTHTDVQIEIKDYWGETYADGRQGRQRLLTEIASGKIPDILDLGYNCYDIKMLPYRRLALCGYLEDLRPYINSDPDLGEGALFEAPLKAAEVDGGLYMAFNSVGINTYVGAASLVGDRTSWTLEDLMEVYQSMPKDSTVFEYLTDRPQVLRRMLGMCLDSYVDWDTGESFFDCENFRTILEFAAQMPEGEDIPPEKMDFSPEKMVQYNDEIDRRKREGRQMLSLWSGNMAMVQYYDGQFGEPFSFIGYPVEDGSTGSSFEIANSKLAMSASCKNKDAAWEFIRQTFLPGFASQEDVSNAPNFPYGSLPIYINRSDYEMVKQAYTSQAFEEKVKSGGMMFNYHAVTEEECRRFEDFLNSIEKADLYDTDLLDIVIEMTEPYFAGDKTVDETIEQIQRRVSLYVNEIR